MEELTMVTGHSNGVRTWLAYREVKIWKMTLPRQN